MDVMGIAAMSMSMSEAKLTQGVAIATMKNAMESQEAQAAQLLEMLNTAQPPAFGHQLSVYA